MTSEWRGKNLWITRLPVDAMGRLVNCAPQGREETEALAALLAGVRVYVLREGLEYRQFRKTAALGVCRRLVVLERELREMGVIVVRDCGGKPLGHKKIPGVGGSDLSGGAADRERGTTDLR